MTKIPPAGAMRARLSEDGLTVRCSCCGAAVARTTIWLGGHDVVLLPGYRNAGGGLYEATRQAQRNHARDARLATSNPSMSYDVDPEAAAAAQERLRLGESTHDRRPGGTRTVIEKADGTVSYIPSREPREEHIHAWDLPVRVRCPNDHFNWLCLDDLTRQTPA